MKQPKPETVKEALTHLVHRLRYVSCISGKIQKISKSATNCHKKKHGSFQTIKRYIFMRRNTKDKTIFPWFTFSSLDYYCLNYVITHCANTGWEHSALFKLFFQEFSSLHSEQREKDLSSAKLKRILLQFISYRFGNSGVAAF